MKKIKGKQPYVTPSTELVAVGNERHILAGSPEVKENVSIEGSKEDDEDTEISGAKRSGMWYEWNDKWED
jgi:hypothetical protein